MEIAVHIGHIAASGPLTPPILKSTIAGTVLDAVNTASLVLIIGVTYQLGRTALVDIPTGMMALLAAAGVPACVTFEASVRALSERLR
jgi:hypothetical protein